MLHFHTGIMTGQSYSVTGAYHSNVNISLYIMYFFFLKQFIQIMEDDVNTPRVHINTKYSRTMYTAKK